jgi:hypothetical protein
MRSGKSALLSNYYRNLFAKQTSTIILQVQTANFSLQPCTKPSDFVVFSLAPTFAQLVPV